MDIHSLQVGLTKRNDFAGAEEEVGTVSWDGEDLPTRAGFVSAIGSLLRQVELPWFPAKAWVTVFTPFSTFGGSVEDQTDDPELVAGRLWSYVVAAGQGFG